MTSNRAPEGRTGEALGIRSVFFANAVLGMGGARASRRGLRRG